MAISPLIGVQRAGVGECDGRLSGEAAPVRPTDFSDSAPTPRFKICFSGLKFPHRRYFGHEQLFVEVRNIRIAIINS
jgi:hypothetical protein